jgi:hypothetical protein
VEPDPSLFAVPADYTLRGDEPLRFQFDKRTKPEQQ